MRRDGVKLNRLSLGWGSKLKIDVWLLKDDLFFYYFSVTVNA